MYFYTSSNSFNATEFNNKHIIWIVPIGYLKFGENPIIHPNYVFPQAILKLRSQEFGNDEIHLSCERVRIAVLVCSMQSTCIQYAACKWNCIFDVIACRCSNKNTVWWCIAQYYLLLCTCCMVSTYSQATRRDQNQCSLGSFGLVIKLRDCDIGLERDSSPVEREKKMKRERTRPCTSNHRCRENRYAYKCSN